MDRIKSITIAGREYLLNFSTRAAKAVIERYGDIASINQALFARPDENEGDKRAITDFAEEVAWVLALLIKEGAAYQKIVNHETADTISEEELLVVMSAAELMSARLQALDAVGAGLTATIEVEPDAKNAETTQGK